MKKTELLILALISILLLFSCGGGNSKTPAQPVSVPPPGPVPASNISANELNNGFTYESPAYETIFAMPESAEIPMFTFEGRLQLINVSTVGEITYHNGNPLQDLEHLPDFDFKFVQDGTHLIPQHRGIYVTDHPIWNYIIEPGRVWQQGEDGDYSRASFPFSLVPKGGNSIYHGTMLFVFNDNGISKLWYQITQETATWKTIDMWGLVDAIYHREAVTDAAQLISDYTDELNNKFPTKPISELATDYPGINPDNFGTGLTLADRTLYGLVVNGINYRSACHTRYGEYYYCEYLRFPSFSTSKSAFAGVTLMRLAEKYNIDAQQLLIRDYLPETINATGNWDIVTFGHTLDMATGNFTSSQFMVDEEQFDTNLFFTETFYDDRMTAALSWPNATQPGIQWVYHTSDTFVVTRAMQNYVQTQESNATDIFNFIVDEVYKPIKMGPGAFSTARTEDNNWAGQAFGGYGLWWISDDIAKITTLLNVDNGKYNQQQLLNRGLLDTTMQLSPSDRGVTINASENYNNGFWATGYNTTDGFSCAFWVTEMQGYSGIVVVMMPNGTTYYYASDNREFTWINAVRESDRIAPHCS
ncbi:MAG: beta-lactamase family protein [Gammaproteobacteria bacterium]|nr:beta-lactamase family protein [Gammaproteobacteria bacterium]